MKMTTKLFADYLFEKFREWETTQPKKRSSFSAFARWLSSNSIKVTVNQQAVDSWMNRTIPKEDKFMFVLAEKLGNEVYEILERKPISPYLLKLNRVWEFVPEDIQRKLSEEAEKYETQNISERVQKVSKRRKTGSVE